MIRGPTGPRFSLPGELHFGAETSADITKGHVLIGLIFPSPRLVK